MVRNHGGGGDIPFSERSEKSSEILFAGIDLGWKTNPPLKDGTGVCILDENGDVVLLETVTSDEEIISLLDRGNDIWAGVDAPLIVKNAIGLRRCERMLFDLGIRVLPANMNYMKKKFGGCRGAVLSSALMEMGYRFPTCGSSQRVLFEVYPYGTIHIINGGSVPRYKRGPREERKEAIIEVIDILLRWVPVRIPSRFLEEVWEAGLLKSVTDMLDAVISAACVYAHYLYAGKRTRVIGSRNEGFILLPEVEETDDDGS